MMTIGGGGVWSVRRQSNIDFQFRCSRISAEDGTPSATDIGRVGAGFGYQVQVLI